MNRRRFLSLGVAGLALSTAPTRVWPSAPSSVRTNVLFSAADTKNGTHTLSALSLDGALRFSITVGERCHGGCSRPHSDQHVLFARRPGRHFYVIDGVLGELAHSIRAKDGFHFYGHGAFSGDGRYLYATMNQYAEGAGIIGVFDAQRNFEFIQHFSAGGIGPHELRLHPDGETLIVAVGGIQTHPDYQRIKLNLGSMRPSLALINRHDGHLVEQYSPSHPQLSCRHLDVSPAGVVIAGYQYQGPQWDSPPLLACLDTRNGKFSELALPEIPPHSLHNYIASVAIHPLRPECAVTASRAGKTLILDIKSGKVLRSFDIADCAGVVADDDKGFWITSGTGTVYQVAATQTAPRLIQHVGVHWDNHLMAFQSRAQAGGKSRPLTAI